VEGGALVKTTIKGRNFIGGGQLRVTTRVSKDPLTLTEVTTFTAGGQFMVDDMNNLTFTVPYAFPDKSPTLVDGNPNVGPADIRYENPFARGADLGGCFHYVPALVSFESFAFTLPNTGTAGFVSQGHPQDVKVGDINADGVPDVAVLGTYPEMAWVLWADTFGDIDVNGDGRKPDFAGTFTREAIVIDLEQFSVFWDVDNRSNEIGLAQLDGDPELEILLPGGLDPLPNNARVAIQDVDSTGLTTVTLLVPPTTESWDVANLAVGDFDGDSRDDFAYMTKHLNDATKRRLIIVTSPVTPMVFVQKAYALPASADDFILSKLAAGDWDGNGIDDLIYGFSGGFPVHWMTTADDFRVIVVKIDGAGGVTSQTEVKDLAPRNVRQIVVVDANDDGKDDAIVLWDEEAKFNPLFLPTIGRTKGFGIILDALKAGGPELSSYQVTNLDNRFATVGDVNGDGIPDLILPQPGGDFTFYFGDGKGDFSESGQSWLNVTLPAMTDPYHAVATGDFNNDGLAEIIFPDAGQTPAKLILWLNTSR